MDKITEVLFSPFANIQGRALFLGARWHEKLRAGNFTLHQTFKPFAQELLDKNLNITDRLDGEYDSAFVILPKNMIEARYQIAQALTVLKKDGVIACAGANDAGGKRAKKTLQELGLKDVQDLSGNKARVAWGIKQGITPQTVLALERGRLQWLKTTGFYSQPGLFAWDKIDKGSKILADHLPDDLRGAAADFGCGYGFLSRMVLEKNKNIESLLCIDADARALEACKRNLEDDTRAEFLWADLTQKQTALRDLDFIIMNPPFHEGKKTDSAIGRDFIKRAAESLKKGGQLWMVANTNLPYEKDLAHSFGQNSKISEGRGFKILWAIR